MNDSLPFSGLNILDISQGIAGPYCAQIMWQQGAKVIKVEPEEGDWGRHIGSTHEQQSALSISYNAGKESIALNAKTKKGQQILHRLVQDADVFIQNFRPGVTERLDLSYEKLQTINPNLIYVSISGYGPSGPYAKAPASDSVMQADSGLMFANQDSDNNPQRIGLLMADIATALYASQQTAAALYQRTKIKKGKHIELSLFEACAALQINDIASFEIEGSRKNGAVSAPNGVFDTTNGPISVLALNNDQFARLCRALDRPEWLKEPRFKTNQLRMLAREELHSAMAQQLSQAPREIWIERFSKHDVLHAPVRDYNLLINHQQATHLKTFQSIEQPGFGMLHLPGIPGAQNRRPLEPAPLIGQHTLKILTSLGLEESFIQNVIDEKIVVQN